MQLWKSFLIAFSVLLPLINPLGSALVFLGLAGEAPPEVYRSLARRIAINNIIFLAIIEVLGAAILNFFGISLPIVQLSGGIVIAAMGWSVLNERDARAVCRNKQEETEVRDETRSRFLAQDAFYPFTFPVTSGPGTLVALLTLTAHISDQMCIRDSLMTFSSCKTELSITGNDASCGPRALPVRTPVSCCGKNPLGMISMR